MLNMIRQMYSSTKMAMIVKMEAIVSTELHSVRCMEIWENPYLAARRRMLEWEDEGEVLDNLGLGRISYSGEISFGTINLTDNQTASTSP